MLFETFKRNSAELADRPAFLIAAGDRSLPITWRQFAADISAVGWLIGKYSPGAVIALLGENSYEWMTTHAACMFSGACVLPLDGNLSAEEIAERLGRVGAQVLVYSSLYGEKAEKVHRLRPEITLGRFSSFVDDECFASARQALASGEKGIFDRPAPDGGRTAMIMFTSGTTTEPRGAELTLDGIGIFCTNALDRLRMKRGERSLMILPVHHIYGIAAAYAMLAAGVALGVCPDYRRLYDAVERFRADYLFLVPALADILASKMEHRIGAGEKKRHGVRWVCTGGAPLSARTHARLSALGIKVLSAYGLTETTALYSLSDISRENPPGCAGEVCAAKGVETKVSGSGELMIRGPNVFKGYFGDSERTAAAKDADGWFGTGDIGRIDSEGRVWITGRASRTIVLSSGKKVAPEELEAKILMYPGILEVMVAGNGENREITAEVYSQMPEGEVRNAISSLNAGLPVYMRVKRVVCRKTPFPRTASGKIALPRKTAGAPGRSGIGVARWLFALGAVATVLFLFALVPSWLMPDNPSALAWQRSAADICEMAGKILFGVFAFALTIGAWRRLWSRRSRR